MAGLSGHSRVDRRGPLLAQGESKPGLSYPVVLPRLWMVTVLSSWSGCSILGTTVPGAGDRLKEELVNESWKSCLAFLLHLKYRIEQMANARNAKMTARAIAPPFFLTLEVGLELTLALTELERASEPSETFDTTSDTVVVVIGEIVEGAAVVVEAVTEEVVDGLDVILCTLVVVEDGEVVETVEVLLLTASV